MGDVQKLCPTLPDGTRIVINLSGRGDKDVNTAAKYLEEKLSLDGPLWTPKCSQYLSLRMLTV